MKERLQELIAQGQSYPAFREMVDALLAEDKTTGDNHSEDYLHYTRLNVTRMVRLDKKSVLSPELESQLSRQASPMTWLVLVEAWCGDVAQNLPIIHKMAEASPNIELKMVLRDENLDVMDQFLTDGGRGVPKLIAIRNDNGEIAGTWGPRPAPAQEMIRAYKKLEDKPPYSEFVKGLQLWYSKDKNQTIQQEFLALIKEWDKSPVAG